MNGFAVSGGKPAPVTARTHEFFALGKGDRCAMRVAAHAAFRVALHVPGPTSRPPPQPELLRISPLRARQIYGVICALTAKAPMKKKKTSDRISEIVAEMHSIAEFAEGSISSSSNGYTVKDGTRRKARPHWKFQSLGARGERKYTNIPESLVPRARKMVANGRRYRELEREYARLVTEESLAALKKTAGEG